MSQKSKTETLFGGRTAAVLHEDGTSEEIRIRQLRLADYEKAFALQGDEFAFTAFCCSAASPQNNPQSSILDPQSRGWALTLQPEAYETLQKAVQEVNANGFFSYAGRRQTRDRAEQARMMETLAGMPPEALKTAMELGRAASISPTSSPTPRPRPV